MLITGATGHIGGRLVPVLEGGGVRLRCLARRPAGLALRVSQTTEVVAGDLLDPVSLDRALAGIDVAYYLVHSMGAHGDYFETDRVAARNFGDAARRAGVRRIVYLGGLATGDNALSKHLKSRIETGEVLRASGVPMVEFRASVVTGSGSLSFELIRALVERLPVRRVLLGDVAGAAALLSKAPVSAGSNPNHPGHTMFPLLAMLLSNETIGDALVTELDATARDPLESLAVTKEERKPKLPTPSIVALIESVRPGIAVTDPARDVAIDAMRIAAEKRVDGILGNSRRQHYGHAALLVPSCIASAPTTREAELLRGAVDLRTVLASSRVQRGTGASV